MTPDYLAFRQRTQAAKAKQERRFMIAMALSADELPEEVLLDGASLPDWCYWREGVI
jgi:hypothetical protein